MRSRPKPEWWNFEKEQRDTLNTNMVGNRIHLNLKILSWNARGVLKLRIIVMETVNLF